MKRLPLLLAILVVSPFGVFSQSPVSGSAAELFVPRHLAVGSAYLIPANILLGMVMMVSLICLLTGLRSRETTYLYLGLFYVGAFVNAVGNLYTVFAVPTVEPYLGSWIMVSCSVLFFGVYLDASFSRAEKTGGMAIAASSAFFFVLMVFQEILGGTKWETLNAVMDFAAAFIMAVLFSWLLVISVRGSRKGRDLLLFESIIVLGGVSAMGVFKRSVIGLGFVPAEFLDGNFFFLAGMAVNGFLFIHLLNRGYADLKVARALAELENRELKELDRAKTDFMMNVSHEFKTPITVIDGVVKQLREGRWGDSLSANARHLETIERNNLRLFRQVSNLLELARLEQNRLEPECRPVDLSAWTRAIAAEFEPLSAQRGIRMISDTPEGLELTADPALLESAVLNLVSNAIRHTPPGGTISLTADEEPSGVRITISDTGDGIPEDMHEAVFDRFRRGADDDGHLPGGTGIGLSLVKEIMERHGGRVDLESRVGEGSRFHLCFPADSTPGPDGRDSAAGREGTQLRTSAFLAEFDRSADHPPPMNPRAGLSDTILVVEDNPDLRSYLSVELSPYFRVRLADDGIDALDAVSELAPDLIISDIMMPRLNGYDLFEKLQEAEKHRRIPFLFLTARGDHQEKLEALGNGVVDFIEKPFRTDELIVRARNIISMNRDIKTDFGTGLKTALMEFIERYGERAAVEGFPDLKCAAAPPA